MLQQADGTPATIVKVVVKNTSTLDTILPLFWRIRQDDSTVRLAIQYCVADRRQVLRDGTYVDDFCRSYNVEQWDWGNDLRWPFRWCKPLWHWAFRHCYSDGGSLRSTLRGGNFWRNIPKIVLRLRRSLERLLTRFVARTGTTLQQARPDIILLDNRARTNFIGRDRFYEWLDHEQLPVVLLPHAPHYIHPWKDEFCPFDAERSRDMTTYTEHWSPFSKSETWRAVDEVYRNQFLEIGYPGLDSEWIEHRQQAKTPRAPETPLYLLVFLRKFLPIGVEQTEHSDPFTLTWAETEAFLRGIAQGISHQSNVKLLIKPHPSSSRSDCREMIKTIGLSEDRFELSYEPFYALLPRVDALASQFSTLVVTCILHGLPTVLSQCGALKHSEASWSVLADLYGGLQRRINTVTDLPDAIHAVIEDAQHGQRSGMTQADMDHVRQFFPDGASDKAIHRLAAHLDTAATSASA